MRICLIGIVDQEVVNKVRNSHDLKYFFSNYSDFEIPMNTIFSSVSLDIENRNPIQISAKLKHITQSYFIDEELISQGHRSIIGLSFLNQMPDAFLHLPIIKSWHFSDSRKLYLFTK